MAELTSGVNVKLSESTASWFRDEAKRLHMSVSAFARMFIEEMLTKHGEFKIEYRDRDGETKRRTRRAS